MSPRSRFPAVVASLVLATSLGCAGSRPRSAKLVMSQGAAPDDVALHGNPNAPYITAGGTPKLVPRATETDAKDARPCDPNVLSVDEIAGNANANTRSVKLAFMNRGATPCILGGYPRVSLLGADGQKIGSISVEKVTSDQVVAELSQASTASTGAETAQLTLMPRQVAAFEVVWTTGPDCSRVARIAVQAPGLEHAFSIAQPMRICAGQIRVTALRLDEGDV
jgi:hypothetical protein